MSGLDVHLVSATSVFGVTTALLGLAALSARAGGRLSTALAVLKPLTISAVLLMFCAIGAGALTNAAT